jgi:Ser/Thr protein kinase RdoA (MazF antagonist)
LRRPREPPKVAPVPHDPRSRRRAALHALEQGWGVEARRVRCLRDYWNAVFRVDAREGAFLLRLHSTAYHDQRAIESELRWLEALDGHVRVPRGVRSRSGDYAIAIDLPELGRRTCTLLHWVDGRRASKLGGPTFEELGSVLARLHSHSEAWKRPRSFTRPRWDAAALGRYWFEPHDDRGWRGLARKRRDRYRRVLDRLASLETKLERDRPHAFGLLHADLHRGNVIRAGELVPIDFDDAGFGCHLYDLAVPLGAENASATSVAGRAIVRGYRRVRSLDDDLVARLDDYVAARVVAVALFLRGWAIEDPRFQARIEPYLDLTDALLDSLDSAK